MMDCGALPFCVLVGCSCALWCLLRVVAHGELGQVCPFGKWGGGGYDLDGHSPPVTLWHVQLPPVAFPL